MSKNKRMYGTFKTETFVDNGVLMRRCAFCGKVKPIVDFPRNGYTAAGKPEYRFDCKTCYNIRRHENKNKKTHSDFIGSQKRRGEEAPSFTHQEWKEILIYFGGACAYCGHTPRRNEKLTKDHIVPICRGGTTTQDNIVPACSACNSSKGADDLKAWFLKQRFFSQERLNKIMQWVTITRQL